MRTLAALLLAGCACHIPTREEAKAECDAVHAALVQHAIGCGRLEWDGPAIDGWGAACLEAHAACVTEVLERSCGDPLPVPASCEARP